MADLRDFPELLLSCIADSSGVVDLFHIFWADVVMEEIVQEVDNGIHMRFDLSFGAKVEHDRHARRPGRYVSSVCGKRPAMQALQEPLNNSFEVNNPLRDIGSCDLLVGSYTCGSRGCNDLPRIHIFERLSIHALEH